MAKKLKIAKKAYRVWVHSDIGEYPVFSKYDVDITYADNANKAKCNHNWYDGKNEDGDNARYIDVKCMRAPEYDKIEYNGDIINLKDYKKRLIREKRNETLKNLDETDMYYVQDSRNYVGNSVLWHGLNGGGYVCDIKDAHKYTKDEIVKDYTNGRDTDIVWSARHVDANISEHVDRQKIREKYCC